MTLFSTEIIPVSLAPIHVLLPVAIMITYSVILRMKGMTPNDTVCTPGEGNRIDMTRTNMLNPATTPVGFNSATAPVGFSSVRMVSNLNTVPLSSAPLASAPATEVPWYVTPTDMTDYGTKSENMPPPPAYSN